MNWKQLLMDSKGEFITEDQMFTSDKEHEMLIGYEKCIEQLGHRVNGAFAMEAIFGNQWPQQHCAQTAIFGTNAVDDVLEPMTSYANLTDEDKETIIDTAWKAVYPILMDHWVFWSTIRWGIKHWKYFNGFIGTPKAFADLVAVAMKERNCYINEPPAEVVLALQEPARKHLDRRITERLFGAT